MFTVAQIKNAHSKVKSGADFPAYIRDLKLLGITSYETYVTDGHAIYNGTNAHQVASPASYEVLQIAGIVDDTLFVTELKAHQQGKTNYLEFIQMCAATGIAKWIVLLDQMTCIYYDIKGNEILAEKIPD